MFFMLLWSFLFSLSSQQYILLFCKQTWPSLPLWVYAMTIKTDRSLLKACLVIKSICKLPGGYFILMTGYAVVWCFTSHCKYDINWIYSPLSFIDHTFQKQLGLLFACKLIIKNKNPASLLVEKLMLEFSAPESCQVSNYFPNG